VQGAYMKKCLVIFLGLFVVFFSACEKQAGDAEEKAVAPSLSLSGCVKASSWENYYKSYNENIDYGDYKEKSVDIPIRNNLATQKLYRAVVDIGGGELFFRNIIVEADNYCDLEEDENLKAVFAPVGEDEVLEYLKFIYSDLATSSSSAVNHIIFNKTDLAECPCKSEHSTIEDSLPVTQVVSKDIDGYTLDYVSCTPITGRIKKTQLRITTQGEISEVNSNLQKILLQCDEHIVF
jgi:hypothetical protein